MEEEDLNLNDSAAYAPLYYPTLSTSIVNIPIGVAKVGSDCPSELSTRAVNELNFKNSVPYLKHLVLSPERIIYKPPTALQLSNLTSNACKPEPDACAPLPTITLAVETGPFAFNFHCINEVSEAEKIGKLCPPSSVELDGIATELMKLKPDVEESYWECKFWKALTASRVSEQESYKLLKQSRFHRQRLLALSDANESARVGSPNLNRLMSSLSSQISINSTLPTHSLIQDKSALHKNAFFSRVRRSGHPSHPSWAAGACVKGKISHETPDTHSASGKPMMQRPQGNGKGVLQGSCLSQNHQRLASGRRNNSTLEECIHSASHVGRCPKCPARKEIFHPTIPEVRGFRIPVLSVTSKSPGCAHRMSLLERSATPRLRTGSNTSKVIHVMANSASLYVSGLPKQHITTSKALANTPVVPNNLKSTPQRDTQARRALRPNSTPFFTSVSSSYHTSTSGGIALGVTAQNPTHLDAASSSAPFHRETCRAQGLRYNSRSNQPCKGVLSSFTIKRARTISSNQSRSPIEPMPIAGSSVVPFDCSLVSGAPSGSVGIVYPHRPNQPSLAEVRDYGPLTLDFASATHSYHANRAVNLRWVSTQSSTIKTTSAIDRLEGWNRGIDPKAGAKVVYANPIDPPSGEEMTPTNRKVDQSLLFAKKVGRSKQPTELRGFQREVRMKPRRVCLGGTHTQLKRPNSKPSHRNSKCSKIDFSKMTECLNNGQYLLNGRSRPEHGVLKVASTAPPSTLKPCQSTEKSTAWEADLAEKSDRARLIRAKMTSHEVNSTSTTLAPATPASIPPNERIVDLVRGLSACAASVLLPQERNSWSCSANTVEDCICVEQSVSLPTLSVRSGVHCGTKSPTHLTRPDQFFCKGNAVSPTDDLRHSSEAYSANIGRRGGALTASKIAQSRCCVIM